MLSSSPRTISFAQKDYSSLASVGTMVVSVRDTGVGLSEDNLKQLFQEGIQFNANQLQGGQGSGLGLWISKGFVDLHKGSLVASSEGIGRGSQFSMELPVYLSSSTDSIYTQIQDDDMESRCSSCDNIEYTSTSTTSFGWKPPAWASIRVAPMNIDPEPAETPLLPSPASVKVKKTRILVVDDSTPTRKMVCRLLTNAGFECGQAENGQECIGMIQRCGSGELYDVILMDFEMPVLNGPLATEALRNLGYTLPIIGLTGNVLPADKAFFLDKGAQTVLTKPVSVSELKSILESLQSSS